MNKRVLMGSLFYMGEILPVVAVLMNYTARTTLSDGMLNNVGLSYIMPSTLVLGLFFTFVTNTRRYIIVGVHWYIIRNIVNFYMFYHYWDELFAATEWRFTYQMIFLATCISSTILLSLFISKLSARIKKSRP